MARRIDERYYTLITKALQPRENTGKLTEDEREAALATNERELAAATEMKGFNVLGFISALAKAQDLRGS